jgi:hypothetical protein
VMQDGTLMTLIFYDQIRFCVWKESEKINFNLLNLCSIKTN